MLLRRALGFTNISCYHIVCVTTFTSYSINDSSYNNYIFIFIYSENCKHRLPSQQQYPLNNNSFWWSHQMLLLWRSTICECI